MGSFFYREKPLLVLIALTALSVGCSEWARATHFHHAGDSGTHRSKAPQAPPIPLPMIFHRWREGFLTANSATDPTGLVRGIFLGDAQYIPSEVTGHFHEAGLMHLLAASGYNCWIVAFAFGLVAKLLLHGIGSYISTKHYLRARRLAGPLSRLLGAWLFWSWTDQSSPITRSVILISGKFLFEIWEWQVPFSRILTVQYLVSLACVPSLWHSASFQLTFGCLFGMVWVPKLFPQRWKGPIWEYAITSFSACVGTLPATILFFGETNFTSVLTNWFAVPPVSFGVMPLGLLQMMLTFPGLLWLARLSTATDHLLTGLIHALGVTNGGIVHLLNEGLSFYCRHLLSLRFELGPRS